MEPTNTERYARGAAVFLLALGCYFVLRPFIGAMLFAAVLCFSTWPLFVWTKARVGNRDWLAALLLVLVMIVAIALPVALAAQSMIVHSPELVEKLRDFIDERRDLDLPDFVVNLPLIGSSLNDYWHMLMRGSEELVTLAKRFADPAKALLVGIGSGVGNGLVQVLLAIFVAYFFYRDGERVRGMLAALPPSESMTSAPVGGPSRAAVVVAGMAPAAALPPPRPDRRLDGVGSRFRARPETPAKARLS